MGPFSGPFICSRKKSENMPSCGVQAGPSSGLRPWAGFGLWVLGSELWAFGFRVSGFGFRVSGFGFRVSGFGFRVSGFGFRVSGFGFRALGFGLWVRLSASTTLRPLRRVRLAKARLLHQKAAHFPSLAVRAANPLELLIRPANLRGFRYGFDTRKTVRWGRFRGLLFAPEKRAKRGQPDACLAADGPFASQAGASFGQLIGPNRPTWRNQALPQSPATPGFRCRPCSQAHADSATGLIAPKPEKPCDGAVFRAFYSLLKKERNVASRALVWLRMGLLRSKRAHRLGS